MDTPTPNQLDPDPPPDTSDPPLGVHLLTWLLWFWTGAATLFLLGLGFGEGPVPISGETVPRSEGLARVLPVLLPMGLAALGAALALQLRRHWARPAVLLPIALAAFGPALAGIGTRGDVLIGALVVLPIVAGVVWYLYFRPSVAAYFAGLKAEEDEAP